MWGKVVLGACSAVHELRRHVGPVVDVIGHAAVEVLGLRAFAEQLGFYLQPFLQSTSAPCSIAC